MNLPDQILNLRIPSASTRTALEITAYSTGYRDALHDAAELAEKATPWQPIETAPEDGTVELVAAFNASVSNEEHEMNTITINEDGDLLNTPKSNVLGEVMTDEDGKTTVCLDSSIAFSSKTLRSIADRLDRGDY